MKANGTLTFTRQPDGTVTHEWKGGKRIAVTGSLLREVALCRVSTTKPFIGQLIHLEGVELRLVGLDIGASTSGYHDVWIAMREGRLARFMAWYYHKATSWAFPLLDWENKWIRRRKVQEGDAIPTWSLTGILLRPIL